MEDKLQAYDEICNITYINLFTLSKNKEKIILSPFDCNNKEHLFIAYIAKALGCIADKKVLLKTKKKDLKKVNKNLKEEYCFLLAKKVTEGEGINPQEVLDFMRPYASKITYEDNFNFGDIYEAFYETRKEQENDI